MDMRWFLIKHPKGIFLFQGKGGGAYFVQSKGFFFFFFFKAECNQRPGRTQSGRWRGFIITVLLTALLFTPVLGLT